MWRPNSRLARIRKDEECHPNHQDHPNQPNHPNHPNRKKDRLKGNRGRRKRNEAIPRVPSTRTRMGERTDGVYISRKRHSNFEHTLEIITQRISVLSLSASTADYFKIKTNKSRNRTIAVYSFGI